MKKIITFSIFALVCIFITGCSNNESSTDIDSEEITTIAEEIEDDIEAEVEEDSEPDAIVDEEALKAIEESDQFEVKIAKKEIQKNAISGISLAGNDALTFAVENKTGGDITDVCIYMLGVDEKGGVYKLGDGTYSLGSDPYIVGYTSGEEVFADGETNNFSIACRSDNFVSVRAIVGSYKDASGNEIENPLVESWYKAAIVGNNTVLD